MFCIEAVGKQPEKRIAAFWPAIARIVSDDDISDTSCTGRRELWEFGAVIYMTDHRPGCHARRELLHEDTVWKL
jgi:hypothetical protein